MLCFAWVVKKQWSFMNTKTSFNALDLWSFSLQLYGAAGVKEACLSLQSSAGLDVCVLLSACWSAQVQAKAWHQSDVQEIMDQCEAWRENVVLPLRQIRDYLKGYEDGSVAISADHDLRQSVLKLELTAERRQLEMIDRFLSKRKTESTVGLSDAQKAEVAAQNLNCYLAAILAPEAVEALGIQKELQVLVEKAYPNARQGSHH